MKKLLFVVLVFPFVCSAQPIKIKKNRSGLLSFGVRSTLSTFNGGDFGNTGIGFGGQWRLQLSDRVNTDWFMDYITSNVEDFATREDLHIGWSVLFYVTKKPDAIIKPYILAGHCFDWTTLSELNDPNNKAKQFSSAVQGGAGFHVNLSPRLDLSFVSQYMIHLGDDIHAHRHGNGTVGFEKEKGAGLEGHLLFHVGINYKIVDLWGRK